MRNVLTVTVSFGRKINFVSNACVAIISISIIVAAVVVSLVVVVMQGSKMYHIQPCLCSNH